MDLLKKYIDKFNKNDEEIYINKIDNNHAYEWLSEEIPIFECKADYDGIFDFAFPKNVIPHSDSSRGEQVLFYDVDGDYIYSAFMQQYGIDLIDIKELHWHKFKALLNGIGKPTKLNEIMSYRAYTGEHVKAEDQYRKLREAWMPPYIPTEEEMEAEKEFEDYFG